MAKITDRSLYPQCPLDMLVRTRSPFGHLRQYRNPLSLPGIEYRYLNHHIYGQSPSNTWASKLLMAKGHTPYCGPPAERTWRNSKWYKYPNYCVIITVYKQFTYVAAVRIIEPGWPLAAGCDPCTQTEMIVFSIDRWQDERISPAQGLSLE